MGSGTYLGGYRGGYRSALLPGYPPQGFPSAPVAAGLIAWWKSDAGVTASGGNAAAWVDQVGSVSLAPYSGQPVPFNASSINALPGLTFNGTNGMFNASAALRVGSVPLYVLAVCKTGSAIGAAVFAFGIGAWFIGMNGQNSGGVGIVYQDAGSRIQTTPFEPATSTAYCLEHGWDGNTSHLLTFAHNGAAESVTATGGTGTVGGVGNTFTIGNATSGVAGIGAGFKGDICEMLIYNRVPGVGDLIANRQYVEGRYALALGA